MSSTWLQLNGVSNYFEREVKRREFVLHRWEVREKEKMELEAEANRKAGVSVLPLSLHRRLGSMGSCRSLGSWV